MCFFICIAILVLGLIGLCLYQLRDPAFEKDRYPFVKWIAIAPITWILVIVIVNYALLKLL